MKQTRPRLWKAALAALIGINFMGLLFAAVDVSDVIIGSGTDKTSDLSILTTILTTIQSILLFGFGPLLGTGMVLKGFKMVGQAERGEKGAGVLMIFCGAACFGIGPIIEQILKLYR